MTKTERTCERCKLVFVSDKLDGLCPSCLLNNTLDIEDDHGERAFWEDEAPPAPQGRMFSHFEIIEELGRGGMGTVYRAKDLGTERIVALKILQSHHLDEPDLVKRFRSEVRAVTSLDHRHILPVHEVGEVDGIPFFSMKLATGGSLASRLGEFLGRPRQAAQLLVKIARGVQHAHEKGILHRDLKPGNILLDDASEPYVCDFGLAKWIDDDQRLTITSAVLGTPHYIAPEQASGQKGLTIAVDIYSLGAILYELLTGRPPFVGDTVIDTLRQASEDAPAKPSSIVNHTPRDLEIICLKTLEKEPSARYKTAAALADDLENWLAGRPIRARPVGAAEQLWRWARRNPLPATLLTFLAVAVTTIAVGATAAAIKIDRARNRAVAAEKDARQQLYGSLIAQARASRMTAEAGHRTDALAAIKKAAEIRPSLELRNEAIAALTLVDLQVGRKVVIRENNNQRVALDARLKTAAITTNENTIAIRSLNDGSTLKMLDGPGKPVISLVHSGSKYVAARLADNSIAVYDLSSGKRISLFLDHPQPKLFGLSWSDVVFSHDETLLAMGSPAGIEVVEVATGKMVKQLNAPQPGHIAFDHAGRRIAFCNIHERNLYVWDLASDEAPRPIATPSESGTIAWSLDDTRLAVSGFDFSIQVFDTLSWAKVGSLVGHQQEVPKIVFNNRGTMLCSTSHDRTVRLWDLRTFSELVTLPKFGSSPVLGFSPDDQTICTTDSRTDALFINIVGSDRVCTAFAPFVPSDKVVPTSSIAFSPDSQLLCVASTRAVLVFDAREGRLLSSMPLPVPTETSVRFLDDGQSLAVLSRRTGLTLQKYSYKNGTLRFISTNATGQFTNLVFGSPQYRAGPYVCLISYDRQTVVKISDQAWEPVSELPKQSRCCDMVLSPDLRTLVTCTQDQYHCQVWSFDAEKVEKKNQFPGGHTGDVSFSPTGRWLACSGTGANHLLWNTSDWTPGPPLPPQVEDETIFFDFSSDEKMLVTTLLDQVALVALPTGELLGTLDQRLQPTPLPRLRLSPDGSTLAVQGVDNSLCIWNLALLKRELGNLNLIW